jgi:hypothetical protein
MIRVSTRLTFCFISLLSLFTQATKKCGCIIPALLNEMDTAEEKPHCPLCVSFTHKHASYSRESVYSLHSFVAVTDSSAVVWVL